MNFNYLDTQRIYKELAQLASQEFFGLSLNKAKVWLGPLEINDYSICFSLETNTALGRKGIYVKIPKVDERKNQICPIAPADRILALEEYHSLRNLAQAWRPEKDKVDFIKPLGFFEKYNAIVTERVYGQELLRYFRRWDIQRRLTRTQHPDQMHNILTRLGKALSRYHNQEISATLFDTTETIAKTTDYCAQLDKYKVKSPCLQRIASEIRQFRIYNPLTHVVPNTKGLDIRNILLGQDGHLFMLDPGRTKIDYKEADLARFIVTCRIIYWGSTLFLLQLCPHESYEASFLEGYDDGRAETGRILNILLLKELLKNWLLAHKALDLKNWPPMLQILLRRTYIDPFYKRQIDRELAKLHGKDS